MNTLQKQYLRQPLNQADSALNPETDCAGGCGCGKFVSKRWLYFSNNRKARLCLFCLDRLGGVRLAAEWLQKNAIFGITGKLTGFKQTVFDSQKKEVSE